MQQFSSCFDRGDAVAKGRMRARLGAWRRHHGRSREPAPTFPDQMKGEDSRTATRTPPRARCGWKIEAFHKILKSGCKAEESRLRMADRLMNLVAGLNASSTTCHSTCYVARDAASD